MTDASRARSRTRSGIWCASGCTPSPAVIQMAMMRGDWAPIRSASCCVVAIRSRGEDLASQPTLSRFENAFDRADLYRMGIALAETVIERHRRRLKRKAKRITIDLHPTDNPTHGAQQLTFFNGHYDTWCYLPVAGFLTFNEEPDQYLFAYVLRPGNASAGVGALGILSRLLPRLRAAFPRARLRVRLDGGFAAAEMFAFLVDFCGTGGSTSHSRPWEGNGGLRLCYSDVGFVRWFGGHARTTDAYCSDRGALRGRGRCRTGTHRPDQSR